MSPPFHIALCSEANQGVDEGVLVDGIRELLEFLREGMLMRDRPLVRLKESFHERRRKKTKDRNCGAESGGELL